MLLGPVYILRSDLPDSDILLSRFRLSIVTELFAAEWISFTELHRSMDISHGNLVTHLAKLIGEGYVEEEKRFVGRRPNTRYHLTDYGREHFLAYVSWINFIAAQPKKKPE